MGGGGGGRGGRKVAEQRSTLDKLEVSGPHHLSSVTGRVFSLQGRIMHGANGGGGGGGGMGREASALATDRVQSNSEARPSR